jgi:hypothetical protein
MNRLDRDNDRKDHRQMKKQMMTLCSLFLAFTAICGAANASPEGLAQPGQPASAILPDLSVQPSVTNFLSNKPTFDTPETHHERVMNRLWIASLCAVASSTSMDAATSWGKREGNGLLASSDGTFGAKGVSIKAGMLAAVVIPQLMFRHHEGLKGKFAIGNFIEAGIFTGVSVHNLGVTAPR